ncbi:prefoldin domain-containing protein [Stieleria varia]|uniref:Uncharacterized protein n=1 Tax=Stieleria varia TaxID=2528005 RepID=A0A5C5ZWJ1_9BACT|nr:hypothetical protein [Stieleria varia]TWT91506.1 hypothetical protein Pla52n_65970 [Stieleria varia]
MQRHSFTTLFCMCLMLQGPSGFLHADEPAERFRELTAQAPEKTLQYATGLGGSYYADESLVKQFKTLKERLALIKREIASGQPSTEEALREISQIEQEANELREKIDSTKTFVSPFTAYKKTEELVIPLANSKRIIMHGDDIVMRGWPGPGIKVVLEKTILAEEQPTDEEFDAIGISHQIGVAADLVGKTPAERAADEQEFRRSPKGQEMTPEQLESRKEFLQDLFGGFDVYRDFQGLEVNDFSIVGLRGDQGNKHLTYRINSPDGGASLTGVWKRHAAVTVFVPPCNHVLVAGCQVRLDIEGLKADLLLSTADSHDRDYNGSFEVRSIDGNVVVHQAPVRVVDGVTGDVTLTVTDEMTNSGTRHSGGFRTAYRPEPAKTVISNVQGNVNALLLRADLHLSDLAGVVNVQNDYGPTHWTLSGQESFEKPMRIVSHSGMITVRGDRELLSKTPIYAHTQCGELKTNLPREILDDVDFTTGSPARSWSGFVTPSKDRFSFARFERPAKAIKNESRDSGLDLISQAGVVHVLAITDDESKSELQ